MYSLIPFDETTILATTADENFLKQVAGAIFSSFILQPNHQLSIDGEVHESGTFYYHAITNKVDLFVHSGFGQCIANRTIALAWLMVISLNRVN